MDNEDEFPHGGDGGQTSADTSQSKSLVSVSRSVKRSRTSDIWNHFTLEEDENSDKRAYCKKCPKQYLMLPTTGTSNLIRHHGKCSMGVDVERKTVKIDHKVAREKFSRVIIRHDLPFLCVEYEELRDFISYMNPDYRSYTRNTAATDVVKTWEKEKQILKSELERIPSRICLTSDCWTSLGGDGYIALTAHYVDTKLILNSKILSFCDMLPPHSGDALASRIHECLKEWGIEKKVFTLTLDNATANNCMQEILRDRLNLDDNLMCKGKFFHVRCCAHVLNHIVQSGLLVISDALSKIRETVKYIKGSTSRRMAFAECVEGEGEVLLSLDVQTRWNSTYLMLEKALKYQRALNRFKIVDKNYRNCPSTEEWKRAKTIHEILMPFYKITNLMSGRSYSTSNLYFGHVWKIQCLLEVHQYKEDKAVRDMIFKMRLKFDKYWAEYSVILAMGAVLDPRMKFKLLKRCYDELDPTTSQGKIDFLENQLIMLINKYRSRLLPSNVQALLCTRSWLYGFVNDDEDDKGETVVIRSDPASRGKEHE